MLLFQIDLLAGVTRNEGSNLACGIFPTLQANDKFNLQRFEEQVNFTKNIFRNINTEDVMKFYTEKIDKKNSLALKMAFFDFFGDIAIKCPTYRFAKKFAERKPERKTYFYEWTYLGNFAAAMVCGDKTMGICHGGEVPHVFGLSEIWMGLGSELDNQFTKQVLKIWTDFAKTGYKLI